jgi:hypothetical protein
MAIPQINQELEPSDYIYDPSRGLYVALRTIDPAMAEQILDTRKKNRAISRSTVDLYTKFMREGHWVLNGQPIIFADNLLIDGQHRLSACVKTGIPLEVLVVELGDSNAFKTLDQGKRRNGSDVLGIAGYTNTSVIYTALGILEKVKRGGTLGYNQLGEGARVAISNHEVEDVANKYPGLNSSATLAKTFYKSLKVKTGPIAALHYMLKQTESEVVSFDDNDKKSDEFMRILSTGLGLDKGNPILYFRNSLIKQMSDHVKIPPHFIIRGGILTWNNWIKGKKITRFVLGSDSKIPTAVRPI